MPDLLSTAPSHNEVQRTYSSPNGTIRPTQKSSIEGSVKYSLGAPRISGGRLPPSSFPRFTDFPAGCWTCSFRNVRCNHEAPRCNECASLGLVCEYGRPAWLYDDALEQSQREINKRLIKEHKVLLAQGRRSLDRLRQIGASSSVSHSRRNPRANSNGHLMYPRSYPVLNRFHQITTPAASAQTRPDQTLPSGNVSMSGSNAFVRRKGFVTQMKSPLQHGNFALARERPDIYDFAPPASKKRRLVEDTPEPKEDSGGSEDKWVASGRRSTRRREPKVPAADMVAWESVDAERYDLESDTAESE